MPKLRILEEKGKGWVKGEGNVNCNIGELFVKRKYEPTERRVFWVDINGRVILQGWEESLMPYSLTAVLCLEVSLFLYIAVPHVMMELQAGKMDRHEARGSTAQRLFHKSPKYLYLVD